MIRRRGSSLGLALIALVALVVVACNRGGTGAPPPGGGGPVLTGAAHPIDGDLLGAAVVASDFVAFPRPLGDPLIGSLSPGDVIFSDYPWPLPSGTVTLPFLRTVNAVWVTDDFVHVSTFAAQVADAYASIAPSGIGGAGGGAPAGQAASADCPAATWNGVLTYPAGMCVDPTTADQCFVKYQLANCDSSDYLGIIASNTDSPAPFTALKVGWVRMAAPQHLVERAAGGGWQQGSDWSGLQSTLAAFHAMGLRVLVNLTEGVATKAAPARCLVGGQHDSGNCGYGDQCSGFPTDVLGLETLFKVGASKPCGTGVAGSSSPHDLNTLLGRWGGSVDAGNHLRFASTGYFQDLHDALALVFGKLDPQPDAWEIPNEPDADASDYGENAHMNVHVLGGIFVQAYRAYDETFLHRRSGWGPPPAAPKSCSSPVPRLVAGAIQDAGAGPLLAGAVRVALDALEPPNTAMLPPAPAGHRLFDALSFHVYSSDPTGKIDGLEEELDATMATNASFPKADGLPCTGSACMSSFEYTGYWVTEVGIATCTDGDGKENASGESASCKDPADGCYPCKKKCSTCRCAAPLGPPNCRCNAKTQGPALDAFLLKIATKATKPPNISRLFMFSWSDQDDSGGANFTACADGEPQQTRAGGWYGVVNGLGDREGRPKDPNSGLPSWCPPQKGAPLLAQDGSRLGMVKPAFRTFAAHSLSLNHAPCGDASPVGVPALSASADPLPPTAAGDWAHTLYVPGCETREMALGSGGAVKVDWEPGAGCSLGVSGSESKASADSIPTWTFELDGQATFSMSMLEATFTHTGSAASTVEIPLQAKGPDRYYLARFDPQGRLPIFLRAFPTLRCTISGDMDNAQLVFDGTTPTIPFGVKFTIDGATGNGTVSFADPATQGKLTSVPGAKLNASLGLGKVQCDVGLDLVLHTFDQPAVTIRVGWGFATNGCSWGDGPFLEAQAFSSAKPVPEATLGGTLSPAPTMTANSCIPGPPPFGACTTPVPLPTETCDAPPGISPPKGTGSDPWQCTSPLPSSDCMGTSVPWLCNGTCNGGHTCTTKSCVGDFDAQKCGCTSAPGAPGGLYGCFAPGCYACGCTGYGADWMCIDACWIHDTTHPGCSGYNGQ